VQDRTTGYPSLSETFPTLKAAREFRRKVEQERAEGLAGIHRGRQRLADAVAAYTQTAEFRKRKAGRDTLRYLIWWAERTGQLPLARITPELVADHLHTLATFHDPKTGTGYTVPLVGDSLKAVNAQARLKRERCPWVFPSPLADDHPAKFDGAFARIRKAAGLDGADAKGERLVIHSLRHSAATEAGKGGATAFEVAAMTNHRTLAMVQRYTKTDEKHALAAMQKRKQT
jgi:integrase